MINHSFKIRSAKFYKKTDKAYLFQSKDGKRTFNLPKSQVIKFDEIIIENPHTEEKENWIDITVTQWIWNKIDLKKKLSHFKIANDVIIEGETHFGINWDKVILKKGNKSSCFFCHSKFKFDSKKTLDHLVPRSILKAYGIRGGIPNNTVPCCLECNREKANLHPDMFREYVKVKIHETGDPRYRIILFNLNEILV